MNFYVTILGSGAAMPKYDRNCSGQIVNMNGFKMLLDCGESTQLRLRAVHHKLQSINTIFISHLHGDHIFGLPGLLSSMHLCGRTEPVHIYAPKGLKMFLNTIFEVSYTTLQYDLEVTEFDFAEPQEIFRNDRCIITAFPLVHSVPCYGFLFEENIPYLNLRKSAVEEYKFAPNEIMSIKQGNDFVLEDGTVVPNEQLTFPKRKALKYAYCCDTAYTESFLSVIHGADLLCVESTFDHSLEAVAIEKCHCTAAQAAMLAVKASVGRLMLTHFSARYTDLSPLVEEAQVIFPNVTAAIDGTIYQV